MTVHQMARLKAGQKGTQKGKKMDAKKVLRSVRRRDLQMDSWRVSWKAVRTVWMTAHQSAHLTERQTAMTMGMHLVEQTVPRSAGKTESLLELNSGHRKVCLTVLLTAYHWEKWATLSVLKRVVLMELL